MLVKKEKLPENRRKGGQEGTESAKGGIGQYQIRTIRGLGMAIIYTMAAENKETSYGEGNKLSKS